MLGSRHFEQCEELHYFFSLGRPAQEHWQCDTDALVKRLVYQHSHIRLMKVSADVEYLRGGHDNALDRELKVDRGDRLRLVEIKQVKHDYKLEEATYIGVCLRLCSH